MPKKIWDQAGTILVIAQKPRHPRVGAPVVEKNVRPSAVEMFRSVVKRFGGAGGAPSIEKRLASMERSVCPNEALSFDSIAAKGDAAGQQTCPVDGDAESLAPVFRLATCNDLLRLKHRWPQLLMPEPWCWTVKQMGMLFCLDAMHALGAKRVLEVGVGRRTMYDDFISSGREYWAIDKSGFYDAESFAAAQARREKVRMVEGLMGEFSPQLADGYFDLVFSVSVLEHVPQKNIQAVCKDIARVLRPGGITAHSLDVMAPQSRQVGRAYLEGFRAAGFGAPEAMLEFRADRKQNAPLVEPLWSLAEEWGSGKPGPGGYRRVHTLAGTVLILLRKPMPGEAESRPAESAVTRIAKSLTMKLRPSSARQ